MKHIASLLLITLLLISCNSKNDNTPKIPIAKNLPELESKFVYPFYSDINNKEVFSVTAVLNSPELYPKYYKLFAKYGYTGNGYCWESHIIQILEKLEPNLVDQIEFNSEADSFFAYCKSENSQKEFIKVLSPIFSDLTKLEEFIKKADRKRIDD